MGSYMSRLLWMSLASFFLVNLVTGVLVHGMTPAVIRVASRMRAASAARFLLVVRLFPCGFAIFTLTALCVPSYLWLEPKTASEEVSLPCLAAAALCGALWTISITRAARAVIRTGRYIRECRNAARKTPLPGRQISGWVMEGGHSIGLGGIFRPQVVIANDVLAVLSPEQLDVALCHEWAHATSRDNLKRLLTLLVPDAIPFNRLRFVELDRAWARFAEWAADDRAAAGDQRRSLSLAAALVSVARMGIPSNPPQLMTSLVADAAELSARVDRLLEPRPPAPPMRRLTRLVRAVVAILILPVAILIGPSTLYAVHELLETLVR